MRGKVGGIEALARLEYGDPVTLFRQAQGRYRPAEPRTNDNDVVIEVDLAPRGHRRPGRR